MDCTRFPAGLTFPGIYGALAKAHMDRYETSLAHLAKVGIKNHTNGALNPKAQFNTTLRDMMERRKARAEQQGQPVPDWQDEMGLSQRPPGQPVDCLAPCASTTAPPSPTGHPACCWCQRRLPPTSPTSRCTLPASARHRGVPCTTPRN